MYSSTFDGLPNMQAEYGLKWSGIPLTTMTQGYLSALRLSPSSTRLRLDTSNSAHKIGSGIREATPETRRTEQYTRLVSWASVDRGKRMQGGQG